MGNSTITLQAIFDGVSAIGDLNPIFNNTGGFADQPALTIANDVASEFFSARFPWKWKRLKIPPFPLTSYQQDYAMNLTNIGWVENGRRVDINNSTVPPPDAPIFAVRDLAESSALGGWPFQYCWHYNRMLEQHLWPGPKMVYTDPIGTFLPNPAISLCWCNGVRPDLSNPRRRTRPAIQRTRYRRPTSPPTSPGRLFQTEHARGRL